MSCIMALLKSTVIQPQAWSNKVALLSIAFVVANKPCDRRSDDGLDMCYLETTRGQRILIKLLRLWCKGIYNLGCRDDDM